MLGSIDLQNGQRYTLGNDGKWTGPVKVFSDVLNDMFNADDEKGVYATMPYGLGALFGAGREFGAKVSSDIIVPKTPLDIAAEKEKESTPPQDSHVAIHMPDGQTMTFNELVEAGADPEFVALFFDPSQARDAIGRWAKSAAGAVAKAWEGVKHLGSEIKEQVSEVIEIAKLKAANEKNDKIITEKIAGATDIRRQMAKAVKAMSGTEKISQYVNAAAEIAKESMSEWAKTKNKSSLAKAQKAAQMHDAWQKQLAEESAKDRAALIKSVGVKKPPRIKAYLAAGFTPTNQESAAIEDALSFVEKISGHQLAVDFEKTSSRAGTKTHGGNVINIGDVKGQTKESLIETIVHEMGHVIEGNNKDVRRMCNEFVSMRTRGEKEVDLEQFGMPGEMGKKDSFDKAFRESSAYYIGKTYPGAETEVLSMGIQKLYSDPKGFMEKDPQYAALVIMALKASK